MTTLTIAGVRTKPCTIATEQWVTELETTEGAILDVFLFAIDVPWDGQDGQALCRAELDEAHRMIGRRYEVEGETDCDGVLVADVIRELRTDERQPDLFPEAA